jgi:uncharacterized damage-inducible protein DinB
MKLIVSLAICSVFSLTAFAADEAKAPPKFAAEFAKHWSNAKDLTLAVAEAMPAENYAFKPNPEEMSFGEQVAHIAQGNYSYCSRIAAAGASPFAKPADYEKATVMKLVGESFNYCAEIIGPMTDEQITQMRGQSTARELAMGVLTHMAHHRGQIEVYLRLKNIKPPTYKY